MTQQSLRFVTDVLKGQTPREVPDWYDTLGFLYSHTVAGMFYTRSRALGIPLPFKIEKLLRQTFVRQRQRVTFMRPYIGALAEALSDYGVPHAFLKGSVLGHTALGGVSLYDDGERVSEDIDILVKPSDIDAVGAVLKTAGYVQGRYDADTDTVMPFARAEIIRRRINRGEAAPYVKPTGNAVCPFIEVDVNFSLGNTPSDGRDTVEAMVDTAQVCDGNIRVKTLTPALFFLQLCLHQYKESALYFSVERGKDLDLYKLADLLYWFRRGVCDMACVRQAAEQWGVSDRLGAVLRQVGVAFDENEILDFARTLPAEQPYVIDYATGKRYVWTADIRERLCASDPRIFLREAEVC